MLIRSYGLNGTTMWSPETTLSNYYCRMWLALFFRRDEMAYSLKYSLSESTHWHIYLLIIYIYIYFMIIRCVTYWRRIETELIDCMNNMFYQLDMKTTRKIPSLVHRIFGFVFLFIQWCGMSLSKTGRLVEKVRPKLYPNEYFLMWCSS